MKHLKKSSKKSYLLTPFLVLAFWFGSVHEVWSQNTLSKETQNFTEFKGKILDAQTNKVLVFATITIKGTNASTVSNAQGDFVLKVPNSLLKNALEVSFLGYETLTKQLDVKVSNAFNLALEPAAIALNEVDLIIPKYAKTLVEETLASKGENYFNNPTLMTAFYRETIKKRRKNVSLSEAVVSIYKSSYVSNRKDDLALYKARKSTDYAKLDTLALKLQGGPFNTLYIDVMKYPEYLFSETYMDRYKFSYGSATRVNDQLVYIVNFEPRSYLEEPLFKGQLFIDVEHKILTKAIFSLDLSNPKEAARLFVKKKPKNANVWPTKVAYRVDYREKDNKWYYGYSNLQLSFKIDWDDKLFNSVYTLNCEMAITDWENTDRDQMPKRRDLLKTSMILTDEAIGFSDPDFWGNYNIIEPEKSIENAIKKIRKQLSKAKEKGVVNP
tara:strand:- start:4538 stop:5860 length:1323 start_codon:yes stop_codon:yes gene_type:complete